MEVCFNIFIRALSWSVITCFEFHPHNQVLMVQGSYLSSGRSKMLSNPFFVYLRQGEGGFGNLPHKEQFFLVCHVTFITRKRACLQWRIDCFIQKNMTSNGDITVSIPLGILLELYGLIEAPPPIHMQCKYCFLHLKKYTVSGANSSFFVLLFCFACRPYRLLFIITVLLFMHLPLNLRFITEGGLYSDQLRNAR